MMGVVALAFIIHVVGLSSAAQYFGKELGQLRTEAHGVTGTVKIADSKTIVIEDFNYDGAGPDAYIWVGTTDQPGAVGTIVPAFEGDTDKLRAYTGERVIAKLPGSMTVQDYKWISIWCRMAGANFGDIYIPASFANPAPFNLGALPTYAHRVKADSVVINDAKTLTFTNLFYDGNGPDAYFWADTRSTPTSSGTKLIWQPGMSNSGANQRIGMSFTGQTVTVTMPGDTTVYDFMNIGLWCVAARQDFGSITYNTDTLNVPAVLDPPPSSTYPNCKVLVDDEFQVQWRITDNKIDVELASLVKPGNYMAFGLSGSDTSTLMEGSDVTVAWMDEGSMSPMVADYNLQSKAQCGLNDGRGACPDNVPKVNGTSDSTLLALLFGKGITRISYSRLLDTGDSIDKVIPTDRDVFISWALGPINANGRTAKHISAPTDNPQINFGVSTRSTCPPLPVGDDGPPLPPWKALETKDETSFVVEIGQSGGKRGYTGITGIVGWGIAWYVNGLLIPEITVERGVTYTFTVYGGDNPGKSAEYHPFYITTDPEGGHAQLSDAEKAKRTIFAGPTAGPLCSWEVAQTGSNPDDFTNFADYKATLERNCIGSGSDGVKMTWTPDENTPDLVYYQCYTHRFLGWKINVNSAAGLKISLLLLLAMFAVIKLL
ncbi:protein Skeletor, isoforms B/C-like isoform X1 [Asterias amurensis]|uniref:protein Skeletor, isoforms B/C-like isoform X1 n=2 Tax=Asterias amurensis TaxID=7602 RepID=UPI003AB670DC